MEGIKAALFDASGTLIQIWPQIWLEPAAAAQAAQIDWSRLHLAREPFMRFGQRTRNNKTLSEAKQSFRVLIRELAELVQFNDPEAAAEVVMSQVFDPKLWPLLPGAIETLTTLKARGIKLAVVSNWDSLLRGILDSLEISPLLDAIVLSGEVGVSKPDPEIYRIALSQLGVNANEAVHVGDSQENDLQAAQQVGIRTILIDPSGQKPGSVRELKEVLGLLT